MLVGCVMVGANIQVKVEASRIIRGFLTCTRIWLEWGGMDRIDLAW
jgi:hypothetical protein